MKKIIVLGLHNSGSTVLCKMMAPLGINFGMRIGKGKYGSNFEHRGIPMALRRCVKFGQPLHWELVNRSGKRLTALFNRFFSRWSSVPSALKHPFLCAGMTALDDSILQELVIINCTRKFEHAVQGAKRAYPRAARRMEQYQADLQKGKDSIIARAKSLGCPVLDWDYDAMSKEGRALLEGVAAFLGTNAGPGMIEKAFSLYDGKQQHFGKETSS